MGFGGVRVPILFGNDLLWDNLPYSKGFMKFRCQEPSKIIFDFWNIFLVFDPAYKGLPLRNFGISDESFFLGETRLFYGIKSILPFPKLIIEKSQVFFQYACTCICSVM